MNSLTSANWLNQVWLYCTVFLTGAAVMVIELLGTRLIAPFYGASLYVWTSVISVTLIALALGYFIGSRWADRARKTGLALIIALSELLTLLIPWLTGPILLATDSLGLRMGVFVSTLVLFSPSLIMLGMIGPFTVKLATSSLESASHMAMTLKEYSIVTDTLEIDPAVAEAASKYFGFAPTGQTIMAMHAMKFVSLAALMI